MKLEWRKLKRLNIVGEYAVYVAVMLFLPMLFARSVNADFGQDYATITGLIVSMHLSYVLFGASLINQVVIDEFRNRTISLSYGYPIPRRRLFLAKALLISLLVFAGTLLSFVLVGVSTLLLDESFGFIGEELTTGAVAGYVAKAVLHSAAVAVISHIPLFVFGVWKRATIPAVLIAIFLAQFQNLSPLLGLSLDPVLTTAALCLLGLLSAFAAISAIERFGDA